MNISMSYANTKPHQTIESASLKPSKYPLAQAPTQFGMGPIPNFDLPSGKQLLGMLAAFVAVVGSCGAGIGYLMSQGTSKKEPETIQTPAQSTADEVKSLQQQLDAKKAKLEQERKDLEAKLKAVQEAEKQLNSQK